MLKPKVYWITGLSGAGKTTIAHILLCKLKTDGQPFVYLDGDILREVLNATTAHNKEERRELSMTYSRMCRMLAVQGVNVICATVSMFDSVRQWNKKHITGYVEIYIKVPIEVLIQRDQKRLYSAALKGNAQNVLGVNESFEAPKNADFVINNSGSKSPEEITEILWALLKKGN